jgi:hypothetical protein
MTYQASIIKQFIQARLRRLGMSAGEDLTLVKMITDNIRRLNTSENIALGFDENGVLLSVQKIDGFDCLHKYDESAIIISFSELERYFNEQQSVSMEF